MAIRRYGNKGARCQGRYHKGRGFVVMGHWRFHTGIVQHSPLTNSNINTQTPQDRSKAPAPKAPQHHSQPFHPQASTSAKTQPPPPSFQLLPLPTLPSIPPSIPLSPYPAPSHRQTLSRHPPTQTQRPHTGVSSPLYHLNPDPRSFRRRWRRRRILGSR